MNLAYKSGSRIPQLLLVFSTQLGMLAWGEHREVKLVKWSKRILTKAASWA